MAKLNRRLRTPIWLAQKALLLVLVLPLVVEAARPAQKQNISNWRCAQVLASGALTFFSPNLELRRLEPLIMLPVKLYEAEIPASQDIHWPDVTNFIRRGTLPLKLAQTPTCKVDASFPNVVIVGENHGDRLSRDTKSALLSHATRGLLPLASEVLLDSMFLPWSHSKTATRYGSTSSQSLAWGIESHLPVTLVETYMAQDALLSDENLTTSLALHSNRSRTQTIRACTWRYRSSYRDE